MRTGIFCKGTRSEPHNPSEILRTFWSLDHDAYKVDAMTQALGKAKQLAPDDDRVWLALADLATRIGHFDEADDWLNRCERARPDDTDVWNARLRWAQGRGSPRRVCAGGRPFACRGRVAVEVARASLPGSRRGGETRRPSDLLSKSSSASSQRIRQAFERLADLAAQSGEKDKAAALRRHKSEIDSGDRPLQAAREPS